MDIPFREAIEHGGLAGDGAMGNLIYERGVFIDRNFDEINLTQPELVYQIHREYLLAGAHLIETNTYGANRMRLTQAGLGDKTEAINRAGVDIALRATLGAAYVAGSMGPTGLSPSAIRRAEEDVSKTYGEQAKLLTESGVDLLMIETFYHLDELRLAIRAARAVSTLPIIAQVALNDEGQALDGTSPVDLAHEIYGWGADVVGANCNGGPGLIFDFVTEMVKAGHPVCSFPNAGRPQRVDDRQIYLATPENFGVYARRMFKAGVKLVGGCCGTQPEHIKRVAAAARMVSPIHSPAPLTEAIKDNRRKASPLEERSALGRKLGREFVFSVEVNPGSGLTTDRQLEAAKMLIGSGADIINIADGPRATVRMSNLALAVKMQSELDVEVLLHVCCRDRNLLGQQAFVLGAHVLGIRNLVLITGDPPKVGDYPDATAVYDQDSVGLLSMINGYNHGIDLAGKPMQEQTQFVLCTGVEPGSLDFEREMMRLRQKIDAGANAVMTQPIYDPNQFDRFLEASKELDVPVLVGILPLASYQNAEFIHNHIPGMNIPEETRKRMKAAGQGEAARAEGVKIAIEALQGIKDRVAGAYIMPPLRRFEMAAEIIDAFGEDRSLAPGVPGRLKA